MTYTLNQDLTSKSYLTRMILKMEKELTILYTEAIKYIDTDSPVLNALGTQISLYHRQLKQLNEFYQRIHGEKLILVKDYNTGDCIVVTPKKPTRKGRVIYHNFSTMSTTDS